MIVERDVIKLNSGERPKIVGRIDISDPDNEARLLKSGLRFARDAGTPMLLDCLWVLRDHLDAQDWNQLVIDTRSHLLFEGHYPCIPGWHCDFVNRNENGVITPDPEIDKSVRHFICVSHTPTTAFAHNRNFELYDCPPHWREISESINSTKPDIYQIEPGAIYEFDAQEIHKGVPATETGWRWFFRATLFPKGDPRRGDAENKIRKHVQVYLTSEHTGW